MLKRLVDPTMRELFMHLLKERMAEDSDIAEHLPTLFTLAVDSQRIVEFGVRSGNSTVAFLAGHMARTLGAGDTETHLYSYDFRPPQREIFTLMHDEAIRPFWSFEQADTSKLPQISECDLLFIDTLHTEEQVRAELTHWQSVNRWIVLHDTVLFGTEGEAGGGGILRAIHEFLRNPYWRIFREYRHNNGLMILERRGP